MHNNGLLLYIPIKYDIISFSSSTFSTLQTTPNADYLIGLRTPVESHFIKSWGVFGPERFPRVEEFLPERRRNKKKSKLLFGDEQCFDWYMLCLKTLKMIQFGIFFKVQLILVKIFRNAHKMKEE